MINFSLVLQIYKDVKHRNRRQLSMSRTSATATQQARRKQEDNLAVVFMGIVLIFLICHAPRNLISMVEMFLVRNAINCEQAGREAWPKWLDSCVIVRCVLLLAV